MYDAATRAAGRPEKANFKIGEGATTELLATSAPAAGLVAHRSHPPTAAAAGKPSSDSSSSGSSEEDDNYDDDTAAEGPGARFANHADNAAVELPSPAPTPPRTETPSPEARTLLKEEDFDSGSGSDSDSLPEKVSGFERVAVQLPGPKTSDGTASTSSAGLACRRSAGVCPKADGHTGRCVRFTRDYLLPGAGVTASLPESSKRQQQLRLHETAAAAHDVRVPPRQSRP